MGCASSTPVVVSPPEPLPKYDDLLQKEVELDDPPLSKSENKFVIEDEEAKMMIFRQIGKSNKGDSFQLENLDDTRFHDLRIDPAKPGLIGPRNSMEDMVFLHYEGKDEPLAYAMRDPTRGLDHYLILRPTPLSPTQKPSHFKSPFGNMYTYANVEFLVKEKFVRVHPIFHKKTEGEQTDNEYITIHQCNPKVWVVKKKGNVSAVVQQVQGVGLKFTCWRLLVCKGVDPMLIGLLSHCIASFLKVAKTQGWTMYPKGAFPQDFDWPEMDQELQRKLFGY